ncbi:hypothetical protein HY230_03270 [Candidatus Acetothermia bacterium]|nr:hypothetical protein [Candidatus Acetothermia bacterium]
MSAKVARGLIFLSATWLAFSLAWGAHWAASSLIAIVGIVWTLNTFVRWYFWSSFAFLVLLGGSALLVLWGGSEWIGLLTAVMALLAWDLESFHRRLRLYETSEGQIEWAHLQKIGLIGIVGLALASIPLAWHFVINLGWALFAAIVLMGAVILTLRWGGRTAG